MSMGRHFSVIDGTTIEAHANRCNFVWSKGVKTHKVRLKAKVRTLRTLAVSHADAVYRRLQGQARREFADRRDGAEMAGGCGW